LAQVGPSVSSCDGSKGEPILAANSMWPLWVCGLAFVVPAEAAATGSFDAFLEWLHHRGALLHTPLKVGVDPLTGLRGLVTGAAVNKDDVIFELPPALVLTSEAAQAQGVAWQQCSADPQAGTPLSPMHTSFALFILEQQAAGSPWGPWVSVLPDNFAGFPLMYSDAELAGLQASPLARVIKLDREAIASDHKLMTGKRPNLTLEEFQWARTAVKSRVFGLKSLSGGVLESEMIAMVPLADFINHPPDGVAKPNVAPFYDASSGSFRLTAVSDIARGDGLYWDYGFQSNRHSLLRYGFASKARVGLTDMPFFFRLIDASSTVGISHNLKMEIVRSAEKAGILTMEADGTVLHELKLALTGATAEKLLGHVRFMVVQAKNSSMLQAYCGDTYCRPISLDNERSALKQLSSLLEKHLESYGTSADEDKATIDSGKLGPGDGARWDTLIVRFGEKQVLRGFIRLLGALDTLTDLSPWSLARIVSERWNNPSSDIHRYVQTNLTALVELEGLRWAKRKIKEDRLRAEKGAAAAQ